MAATTAVLPLHKRLARRNRRVRVLRLVVPFLGALVLLALLAQIIVSNSAARFAVGTVSVSPEAITVEAPQYLGALQDGSSYRVSADSAVILNSRSDIVDLATAKLVLDRADGVQLTAEAAQAQLDATNQKILIEGVADVADSRGTTGTLRSSVFDWQAQLLTSDGEIAIDYADGTTVRAQGLVYDAAAMIWTFERSVVTLPATPGQDDNAAADPEIDP